MASTATATSARLDLKRTTSRGSKVAQRESPSGACHPAERVHQAEIVRGSVQVDRG